MAATRDDLMKFLHGLDIETATVEHPPLFTVEESKRLRGEIPGAHTTNLFLKSTKDELFLLTALESTPVGMSHLHKALGSARLSFGKPDLLLDALGVTPGSVTPFALINDEAQRVRFVLDEALLGFDVLNFHPLENTATTAIARDGFLRFLAAIAHSPLILRLEGDMAVESAIQP